MVERASEIAVRMSCELGDFVGELVGVVDDGEGTRLKVSRVGVRDVDLDGDAGGMERLGGVDGREGFGTERGMESGVGTRRGMRSTAA